MIPTSRAPLCLVTCNSGARFANLVSHSLGVKLIDTTETWFACGEGKFEINTNIRGHDVYIIQSPVCSGDGLSLYDRFVMLLHAIDAASMAGAEYITAVLPYFPGARQDKRKGIKREGISAGLFARMLQRAGAGRVLTVEVHNDAIAGMFDPVETNLENAYLTRHLTQWLQEKKFDADVVVSPDVGGLERARRYAEALSIDMAAISKQRDYSLPNRVISSTLIGDVDGRNVLVIDDIIDTAGSVVSAVTELKKHGAKDMTIACIHPVFSDPAVSRLHSIYERSVDEGWKFRVVGTTSIFHESMPNWYLAFGIEGLVARIIESINTRQSVTGIGVSCL